MYLAKWGISKDRPDLLLRSVMSNQGTTADQRVYHVSFGSRLTHVLVCLGGTQLLLSSDIFHPLPFHKDWDVKSAIRAFLLVYHLEEALGQIDNSDFVSHLEIMRDR